jgi:multiple sugar transport system substrate-binding protein
MSIPVAGRRRHVRTFLALIGSAAVVVACGTGGTGSTHASGPQKGFRPGVLDKQYSGTTINVLVPPWAALPAAALATFTGATGIKVKQQTLDFNTVHDKIVTSEAAQTSPADVTEMDWTWVSQFARADWYADLSKYLPTATISNDVGNSIFQYKGAQVAVPYNLDFRGTVVDMTVLNKAGITKPPTSWSEVLAAAQAVRSRGGQANPVALPLSVTEGSATPWYALTKAAGGEVLDADQNAAFAGTDSGGRKALAFIKQLYDGKLIVPGAISLTDQDVVTQFLGGQAAIVLSVGPALLSNAKSNDKSRVSSHDLRFLAVPGPDGPAAKLIGLQEGLGIPARSAHREAAAEFLYWWQQAEQQITSYTDPNMGNVPSQQSALSALVGQQKLLGGNTIVALSKQVGPVFSGPAPTWYSQFSTDVASMLQSVAEGHTSVDAAISKLESQAKALKASGK